MADFNNQSWPQPTRAWRIYLRFVAGLKEREWQGRVVGPLLRFGYDPTPTDTTTIEWMGTCNTLVNREAFQAAGGFSQFFLHRATINEDVDLGLKLRRVGEIIFCPRARMGHFHAPGGRLSPFHVTEDDLFNRYWVLTATIGQTRLKALGFVLLYWTVETMSNAAGCLFRRQGLSAAMRRAGGGMSALVRIVFAMAMDRRASVSNQAAVKR